MDLLDLPESFLFPGETPSYVENPHVDFSNPRYKDLVRYFIDGHHVVQWENQRQWHSNCRNSDDYVVFKWVIQNEYNPKDLELIIEDVRNITAWSSSYYFANKPSKSEYTLGDLDEFTFYTRQKIGYPYRPDNKAMRRLWKITYVGYIHCCFVVPMIPICILNERFYKKKPQAPRHFEDDKDCVKDLRYVSMRHTREFKSAKRKEREHEYYFVEYVLSTNRKNNIADIIEDFHAIIQMACEWRLHKSFHAHLFSVHIVVTVEMEFTLRDSNVRWQCLMWDQYISDKPRFRTEKYIRPKGREMKAPFFYETDEMMNFKKGHIPGNYPLIIQPPRQVGERVTINMEEQKCQIDAEERFTKAPFFYRTPLVDVPPYQ